MALLNFLINQRIKNNNINNITYCIYEGILDKVNFTEFSAKLLNIFQDSVTSSIHQVISKVGKYHEKEEFDDSIVSVKIHSLFQVYVFLNNQPERYKIFFE